MQHTCKINLSFMIPKSIVIKFVKISKVSLCVMHHTHLIFHWCISMRLTLKLFSEEQVFLAHPLGMYFKCIFSRHKVYCFCCQAEEMMHDVSIQNHNILHCDRRSREITRVSPISDC
jgi:hypothetical protein